MLGTAYNAKIALYDIGVTGQAGLTTPNPLDTGLFLPLYNDGARIFSNSWGTIYLYLYIYTHILIRKGHNSYPYMVCI